MDNRRKITNRTNHNTDNKINRLVKFFALAFRYLDNLVKQDKSGPFAKFIPQGGAQGKLAQLLSIKLCAP